MALQYSEALRNAQLDAWETIIGASPILRLYAEAPSANTAAAAPATCIAEGNLPADFAGAAAAGSKTILNGPFSVTGLPAASTGTNALSYRIYASDGITCHEQGVVTTTGGGGEMTMDNVNVADAQSLNVNTMTRNAGNA